MIPFVLGAAAGAGGIVAAAMLSEHSQTDNDRWLEKHLQIPIPRSEEQLAKLLERADWCLVRLNLNLTEIYTKVPYGGGSLELPDQSLVDRLKDFALDQMLQFCRFNVILQYNTLREHCQNFACNIQPVIRQANLKLRARGKTAIRFKDLNFKLLEHKLNLDNDHSNEDWDEQMLSACDELATFINSLSDRIDKLKAEMTLL